MSMSLRMIQKPPVVFTQYDPSTVLSPSDLAATQDSRRDAAVSWLWMSYGRSVLAAVDPCMEANEGAAATTRFLSGCRTLSRLAVKPISDKSYELKKGNACLYLSETDAGDVFLYFFPPEKCFNRREECRIDLTDYGSDAAAYFIATIFGAYERIALYLQTCSVPSVRRSGGISRK